MYKPVEMDYSLFLGKPFLVGVVPWSNLATQYLNIASFVFPIDFYSNPFLATPFARSSFFRCKARAIVQVSGTPLHQGILLVSAMPPAGVNYAGRIILNSRLNAPHACIAACEAGSVSIDLPFYANSKLLRCDLGTNDVVKYTNGGQNQFCNLDLTVLNQLVAPTSGTTSVSVTVHVTFDELEFYCPFSEPTWEYPEALRFESQSFSFSSIFSTMFDNLATGAKRVFGDVIDASRSTIRSYTGLDNGTRAAIDNRDYIQTRADLNSIDTPIPSTKLDPNFSYDRIMREYLFETSKDEMLIRNIVSKPQFICKVPVTNLYSPGTLLMSRPITPQMEVFLDSNSNPVLTTNLSVLAYLTRYWRGGLKLIIQANMTNFHYCKLAVYKHYSPHMVQHDAWPEFLSIQGQMIDFLEFSGGGQTHEVKLPYCSTTDFLENSRDWRLNAMQHGTCYLYLVQPLVASGTISTSISFNIYLAADDDFQFAGYSSDAAQIIDNDNLTISTVMEAQSDVSVNPETEIDKIPSETDKPYEASQFKPIVSIRDLMRRPTAFKTRIITATDPYVNYVTFPINEFIGQGPISSTNVSNTVSIARRFFLGMDGGVRLKIHVKGSPNARVWFIPPASGFPDTAPGPPTGLVVPTIPITTTTALANSVISSVRYDSTTSTVMCPQQEATNYFLDNNYATGTTTVITDNDCAAECILDITIPNMNVFRFMGDCTGYFVDTALGNEGVNDMGKIIISFKPIPAVTTVNSFSDVVLNIYSAVTDETRCGFQVKAPTIRPITINVTSGDPPVTTSCYDTVFQVPGLTGLPANPVTRGGYNYFTKT
jgi:hypothetical protein